MDKAGFDAELKELAPTGTRRMSANPHANGGRAEEGAAAARFSRVRSEGRQAGHDSRPRTRARWATSCAT